MFELSKLTSASQWPALRKQIEDSLLDVLGRFPKDRAELQVKIVDERSFRGYVRRRVNYFIEEWERVSAWLFIPEDREEVPAILCCHQTVPEGKDEAAGLSGNPNLAFAQHYAELGYVTLAPDCITAGERVSPGLQAYDTAAFYKENPKRSALAKMLWDHIHAIDMLGEVSIVDAARIGVIGHSLGGYNALLLSAFDDRVQACVSSCGFTRFADDEEPERWTRETGFCHAPKLRDAVKNREFAFDWEHILALGAPTPTLLLTARNDSVFPNTQSCDIAVDDARKVYELLGASDAIQNFTHSGGHAVTREALQEADEWFDRWL